MHRHRYAAPPPRFIAPPQCRRYGQADEAASRAFGARRRLGQAGRGPGLWCCSLQPQEGEAQIDSFLEARDDFTLDAAAPTKRFTPDNNMDGFYLALMRKGGEG